MLRLEVERLTAEYTGRIQEIGRALQKIVSGLCVPPSVELLAYVYLRGCCFDLSLLVD
jgi:hypothetical protein